jgi:hypothetical protein
VVGSGLTLSLCMSGSKAMQTLLHRGIMQMSSIRRESCKCPGYGGIHANAPGMEGGVMQVSSIWKEGSCKMSPSRQEHDALSRIKGERAEKCIEPSRVRSGQVRSDMG